MKDKAKGICGICGLHITSKPEYSSDEFGNVFHKDCLDKEANVGVAGFIEVHYLDDGRAMSLNVDHIVAYAEGKPGDGPDEKVGSRVYGYDGEEFICIEESVETISRRIRRAAREKLRSAS